MIHRKVLPVLPVLPALAHSLPIQCDSLKNPRVSQRQLREELPNYKFSNIARVKS